MSVRHNRVVSSVEEEWYRSTVYSDQPDDVTTPQEIRLSRVSQDMENEIEEPSDVGLKEASIQEFTGAGQSNQIIEEEPVTADFRVPDFQAALFATVVEDTITELRVLVSCNTEIRISKTMADMSVLLARKYGVTQAPLRHELDAIDPQRLTCFEYKLNKLDADRTYFGEVLAATYTDWSVNRSYRALTRFVNSIDDRDNYRVFLQEDEAKNRITRRELARQLRQQRNHVKSVIYDTDVAIDMLKTQVEDAALNGDIRGRYVENWQDARTEQHTLSIAEREKVSSASVERYKQRSDHEQRVHTEVELLINIAINETLQKIENWMDKYDKDIEAMDLKIQIKKNDYQNMLDKRINLEETIENHDLLMKDWVAFKAERERIRLYREKMTNSAVSVQAWWRGLLVRLELGPYRVAKKKGGAAAKKKK